MPWIGADARNALFYDSVADMKLGKNFDGSTVITNGYYKPNDGGGGTYIIRTKKTTDVDDGGSIHFLNDDLVAELIVENGTVNVKQFGAYGDGKNDDYNYFVGAINFSKENGFEIKIPTGTFLVSKQLNLESVIALKITGSGDINSKYATKIIYNGNGSFLNIDGCKNIYICNFYLEAKKGTGISLTGDRSFNCHFSDIHISDMIYGIYITATTGYTYFDRIKMGVSENTVNGIFIDCDNEIYTNYVYFRQCAIDALQISDDSRTFVYLGNCYYIYFDNCDICNGHIAIAFDKSADFIFVNDTTLFKMDVGFLTLGSVKVTPHIHVSNTSLRCKIGLDEKSGLGAYYMFSSCSWICTENNVKNAIRMHRANSCCFLNHLENLKDKICESNESMNKKYYLSVGANSTENKEILIAGDILMERYVAISPDCELVINSQSYDPSTKKIKLSVTNKTGNSRGAYFFVF